MIHSKAMLVSLSISVWEARKYDKTITKKTNEKYANSAQAGRYNKSLFGGTVPSLQAVVSAASALRLAHYANTLPWQDDGYRLLPQKNYVAYTDLVRTQTAAIYRLRDEFISEYPQLVRDAPARLINPTTGESMYNPAEYPAVSDLAGKFSVSLGWLPLPSAGDFRLDELPSDAIAELSASVTAQVESATKAAMADAWERLYAATKRIVERLSDTDGRVYETLLGNASELCDVLPRLNVTNDPNLTAMVSRLSKVVHSVTTNELRDEPEVRKETADKVSAILSAMSGLYSTEAA